MVWCITFPFTVKSKKSIMEKPTPRWKNRLGFGRKSKANLVLNAAPEEPDSGEARSLMAKRAQRLAAKPDKKKGGNMIRKLQIKTSFRKESRDASDTSPSNPQSPYSNDSFLTVEVSPRTTRPTRSPYSLILSFHSIYVL